MAMKNINPVPTEHGQQRTEALLTTSFLGPACHSFRVGLVTEELSD